MEAFQKKNKPKQKQKASIRKRRSREGGRSISRSNRRIILITNPFRRERESLQGTKRYDLASISKLPSIAPRTMKQLASSLIPTLTRTLSLSLFLSVSVSVFLTVSVSLYLLTNSLSLTLSLFLSLSLSLSHSHAHSQKGCRTTTRIHELVSWWLTCHAAALRTPIGLPATAIYTCLKAIFLFTKSVCLGFVSGWAFDGRPRRK